MAFSGEDYARTTWQPTIDYLNRHIPQHEFSVIPVEPNNIKHLEQLVKQEKVDFVITQPWHQLHSYISSVTLDLFVWAGQVLLEYYLTS